MTDSKMRQSNAQQKPFRLVSTSATSRTTSANHIIAFGIDGALFRREDILS